MKKERGIALIIVILAVCAIVPVVINLQRTVRSTAYESMNSADREVLYFMAASGFNIGQGLLMNREVRPFTGLTERWAKVSEMKDFEGNLFPAGRLRIVIEDELGKIPLNMLVSGNTINGEIRNLLIRLLCLPEFNLSPKKAEEIVAAIVDWIDADEEVTPGGAESMYYRTLPLPYDAKGAPMDDIYELLMIKGITKELFYGQVNRPGLKDLLTLHGTGKININTAPLCVLRALDPQMTNDLAMEMDIHRRNESNDLSDLMWYKRVRGMTDITINRDLISVKSDLFRIRSEASIERMKRTVTGVIELRAGNRPRILTFRWDE